MASPRRDRPWSGRALPSVRVQHFALAERRGSSAPALVDYILLAEFDVDSGRLVVLLSLCVCMCVPVIIVAFLCCYSHCCISKLLHLQTSGIDL